MIFDKVCLYIILQASLLSLPPFLPTNLMARAGFLRAARYHPCGTVFVGLDSTVPRSANIAEKKYNFIAINTVQIPAWLHSTVTGKPLTAALHFTLMGAPYSMELRPKMEKNLAMMMMMMMMMMLMVMILMMK